MSRRSKIVLWFTVVLGTVVAIMVTRHWAFAPALAVCLLVVMVLTVVAVLVAMLLDFYWPPKRQWWREDR
jgi:hypothetical protein